MPAKPVWSAGGFEAMRGEPNVAARGCRPVAQRAAIYAALKPKGVLKIGLLRFGADGETGRGWE